MLTGRLVTLRPIRAEDLGFLADLANTLEVRRNVVGWDWPVSPDAQHDWFAASLRDSHTHRLTVTDVTTGAPIGLTGLWDVDWHNQSASTAVKLMPGTAPKGAGSDSIMLIMAWSFYEVGLRRLYSTILDSNAASLGAYVRNRSLRLNMGILLRTLGRVVSRSGLIVDPGSAMLNLDDERRGQGGAC